ncbi:hypothetical protein K440DRAFT_610202 [Wilcoxina mikolae CBS 423.85]|nr:hypothetical protein K440DRAFT_610202 [Wilcoxina mikolae CBS 423.85]
MDQPRIDKFEELFSEIEGFVLDNIPQSDVLGFGAEKISKDCDAWEECTKALWVQSVIADTIHRELFEDEGIESSDVAVKKPPPESVISTLSTTLSEMLCCADKSAGATQALHLSQKAYACAYILQKSQTRYTWAQNPGQTKVRGNSARVRAVLAGGKIEGGKLYEVAFTVFGALIKYYGENGEKQVEINKARVVARDSLED